MLYDIRLELSYDYEVPVQGGRHLVRVVPTSIANRQRVVAASLSFEPQPERQSTFSDFFGNSVTTVSYASPHEQLRVRLKSRIQLADNPVPAVAGPELGSLQQEISRFWSVQPSSPHHFLARSPLLQADREIENYANEATSGSTSVFSAANALCLAIHRDFIYEPGATHVETSPSDAFQLRRGVCQDFAHVMIAGLRSIGIPAGYVSGFLRTNPPPGMVRLEGTDAMHAWVRVWCGQALGWAEFDPTNAMLAGSDHIAIGVGRDYSDVSPIVGVLRTHGTHVATQSVDVVRVD